MNLLPVDASANRQKGDADAATWLPPNKAYRCAYVARQVTVKAKYDLWVTPPEQDAMERVLGSCPDQPLPEGLRRAGAGPGQRHRRRTGAEPVAAGPRAGRCTTRTATRPGPRARPRSTAGDPGYGPHLDGDGDGVACE